MAMLASKSQYISQPHSGGAHFQSNPPSAISMLSQSSPTNSEFSEGHGFLEDIRSWDERRVLEWLRSIGYQKYDTVFEKNNITGETLLECDHSVLKEIGITKVGDRVRIFVAVKALRNRAHGNNKKRNRDTLAALDNVGPMPTYRTTTSQQLNHLTPPRGGKRQSGNYSGASVLSSNVYSSVESPVDNDQSLRGNTPRIISPQLGGARSEAAKTPRTPRDVWKNSSSQANSPNSGRARHNPSTSFEGVMGMDAVRQNCIKVISEGGARVVEVSGATTMESVMKKILKKFGITENWTTWVIYSLSGDPGRESVRSLTDIDLLQIVNDTVRPERARLILRRRGSYPSPTSTEVQSAQQIAWAQHDMASKQTAIAENATRPKIAGLTGESPHEIRPASPMSMTDRLSPISGIASPGSRRDNRDSASSSLNRKQSRKITAFFGQRPPSELISSNLAEYFPDHEHKVLERTVRNSIRHSARMSKYNSRLSVATTRSYASSMSGDSIPPVPAVGGIWLNNTSASAQLPMSSPENKRPQSIRRSVLMPTTFNKDDYLGAVPEDDVSPARADRKSYMSFESRDSARDSVNVIVTDTESTASGGYMDSISLVSTPSTDPDMQPNFISQLLNPEDTDEDDEDDEDEDLDENMDTLRWMKGTLIGAGSFGSVYLALNALTGELMAVKQVEMPTNSKEDTRKQGMIDALTREIALLKDLQHQNIVQYLASNKEDNCFNIFLEYVPGGSVAAMLNNYGPLEEPLVRNFVRQILAGLAYLHGKNIIHRDIKGANVLVDNKGGIKISDFGISKKVEAGLLTSASAHRPSLQGSVFWMAPEVVKQTSYTLKADIWSLGCLIVEMFTGSHPYPDCSQLQAIFKIGTSGSAPQIPTKSTTEAKTFLGQTFELDHNKRPTADELLLSPFLLPIVGGQSSSGD
ncbi:hypothetical protein EDC01DRAFT_630823 [Geopyxis carbonaria]|nr:hypothetical protein EDC01DRAFT_630823 [Geopyxis carbonaria]